MCEAVRNKGVLVTYPFVLLLMEQGYLSLNEALRKEYYFFMSVPGEKIASVGKFLDHEYVKDKRSILSATFPSLQKRKNMKAREISVLDKAAYSLSNFSNVERLLTDFWRSPAYVELPVPIPQHPIEDLTNA